jgi:hypothetical protein
MCLSVLRKGYGVCVSGCHFVGDGALYACYAPKSSVKDRVGKALDLFFWFIN